MKTAVILVNLGTPAEPTKKAVGAFLKEFLSDRRVVEVPRFIWFFILNLIVIPFRSGRVSEAYRSIWQEGGSPLRVITEKQTALLQQKMDSEYGENRILVRHAMTYSGPGLKRVISELEKASVEHFLILPLYPQYSATTTASIYDQIAELTKSSRNIPQIHIIKQYFDFPLYIDALAESVSQHWKSHDRAKQLLMSFHSIPERYCEAGDPYYDQCNRTAELLAQKLNLSSEQWSISFQSRLGNAKWLSPYTIDVLKQWGEENLESVEVICPAFAADCLETLEEIDGENREEFQHAGGGKFEMIPCLNDRPEHIQMMLELIKNYLPPSSI